MEAIIYHLYGYGNLSEYADEVRTAVLLDVLVGVAFVVLGVGFFFVQICLLLVYRAHADYRNRVSFQILFFVGLIDSMMLLGFAYEGFVRSARVHPSYTIEKIIGSLMRAGSDSNYALELVLAVNRFIVLRATASTVADNRPLYNACIAACGAWFFAVMTCYLTPVCSANVTNAAVAWINEARCRATFVLYVRVVERVVKAFCCLMTLVLYAVSISTLFKKRRHFGGSAGDETQSRMEKMERHTLIYAITVFVAGFNSLMFGYFGASLAALILSDVFWLAACVARSGLFLLLNKQLRTRFIALMTRKGKAAPPRPATAPAECFTRSAFSKAPPPSLACSTRPSEPCKGANPFLVGVR